MKYVSISLPLILVPEEWIFEIDQIRYFWSVIVDILQSKLSSGFKMFFKRLWCVPSFSTVVQLLAACQVPCLSLYPGVCSNSCPLSQWCLPTISSFVAPFSSYPRSFPASGSFPVSWLFLSGGQSTEASSSSSVLLWIFRVALR